MVTALLLDSTTVAGRIIHKMMTSSTSSSTIALNSDNIFAPSELNSDNDNDTNVPLTFNDLSYVSWRLARLAKSTWTPTLRFPDLPPKTASISEITAVLWGMASLSAEVSKGG